MPTLLNVQMTLCAFEPSFSLTLKAFLNIPTPSIWKPARGLPFIPFNFCGREVNWGTEKLWRHLHERLFQSKSMAQPNACCTQMLFIMSDFTLGFTMSWSRKSKIPDWRKITAGKVILKWKTQESLPSSYSVWEFKEDGGCVQEEMALGTQRNGKSCLQPTLEPCVQPQTHLNW